MRRICGKRGKTMSTRWRRLILSTPPCVKKVRFGSSSAAPRPLPPIVYTTISASINGALIRHELDITSHLHVNSEVAPRSVRNRIVLLNQEGSDHMASELRFNTPFTIPFKITLIAFKNKRSVLFPNSSPRVFKPHMHTECSSNRTRAPPSLAGSWRRVSLLRILALLHHNTHDVSTFHTHIFHRWSTIKTSRTSMQQPAKGARCSGQRVADLWLLTNGTKLAANSPCKAPLHFSLCQLI